jgi:inner membrane protein
VMLSASYLTWSLVAKNTLEAGMHADLKARGLVDYKLLVEPMPFTTILWRIVVMRADGDFYEGFYSFAGPGRATTLDHHPGFRYLLAEVGEHPGLRKLETFTHGFYAATTDGNRIVVNDIRMGAEPDYAFHFEIAERRDGRVVPLPAVKLPWPPMDWARYRSIWERAQRPQTGGDKAPGVDDTKPAATPAPAKL